MIEPKLIVQELWKLSIDWDQSIPVEILERWEKWKLSVTKLELIEIPRWYKYTSANDIVELHIFSDASCKAYGAVSYLRIINTGVHCSFIIGKSRLAPIQNKMTTIPRLELQAAVLAARLKKTIFDELILKVNQVFLWTDSTTVLKYIKNESQNFGQYIMHRTNEIRNNTNTKDWYYISTDLNVADDASRGIKFSELNKNHRWITGPDFLHHKNIDINFATNNQYLDKETSDFPVNINTNQSVIQTTNKQCEINTEFNWEYYSTFRKLTRHIAWIIKLQRIWKAKRYNTKIPEIKYLTVKELKESQKIIIQASQKESYPTELRDINNGQIIKRKSTIISLNPIIKDDLLVVGGRLKSTELYLNCHSQVIINKNHHLAKLIIKEYHLNNLHSGREQTLSRLREKYWIPSCRGLIRTVINECSYCKRRSAKPQQPFMSDIPSDRLAVHQKPFTNSGVDYFGPIIVKSQKYTRLNKSVAKRYGVLFTCLTTRAVHLELAFDMTTDTFILALRRFISRRGYVKLLRSDNGTNFTGAEKELKDALLQLNQTKIIEFLNKQEIEWKFNPPASPWMGGVWEALVKSVKRALRTITKDRIFTEDALTTFLCEVESIVNQRPLTPTSNNINDFEALTPYHFLLGSPSPNFEPIKLNESEINHRIKWKAVQAAANMFWRRWIKEYLPTLVPRKKWTNQNRNLQKGDLVILPMEHTPRSYWPLGRVIETYPGKDNVVRSVKIKTPNNELIRPSSQLHLFEAYQNRN